MQHLIEDIRRVARRARVLLALRRALLWAAGLAGVVAVLAAVDYVFRFPAEVRAVFLSALLVGAGITGVWYVLPAILFRPGLTSIALRAERLFPQLRGRLASGIEFALAGADRESGLAAEAVAEAEREAERVALGEVLNYRRLWPAVGACAAAAVVFAAAWIGAPAHAQIAMERIFVPFGGTEWPRRTELNSAHGVTVHPRGQALPLRAQVVRGLYAGMRVYAHYRILPEQGETTESPWRTLVLTPQPGGMFERLIESDAAGVEVWYEGNDDQTEPEIIRIEERPAVVSAMVESHPPAYAQGVVEPVRFDLGTGDGRNGGPVPGLILPGSEVSITLVFNKAIPLPDDDVAWLEATGWRESSGAQPAFGVPVWGRSEGGRATAWQMRYTAAERAELRPRLVDEHGLRAGEIFFAVETTEDRPPTVTIVEPVSDRDVLATARAALEAEGRDDVAVASLRLESQRVGEEGVRLLSSVVGEGGVERLETVLDFAELGASAGMTFEVTATALDGFYLNGEVHEPVRSTPRRFRIISEADFADQVLRDLGSIRDGAMRLEQDQSALVEELDLADGVDGRARREQERTTERVSGLREALRRVAERLEENRFEDAEFESAVRDGDELLRQAGEASAQAAESLARAQAEEQRGNDQAEQEAREEARESQETTSRRLEELADRLDRGDDLWGARRSLERLIEEQERLAEQTRETTGPMRGRDAEALSEQEQRDLSGLADRQESLAERTESLVDDLSERAERMEGSERELAEALRQAAQRAEQSGASQRQEEAAEQIRDNQGERAEQSQEEAAEALREVLEELDRAEQARAERLARLLDSLAAALEHLIAQQEAELSALGSPEGMDPAARAAAMIQLSVNTLAVGAQAEEAAASASGEEMRLAAGLIMEAAAAQESAVGALRSEPVDAESARVHEEASLSALTQARDLVAEAARQNESQQQRQERQELMAAYRVLYERQMRLVAATGELVAAGQRDRRTLQQARALANEQEAIVTSADEVLARVQEAQETLIFEAGHAQISQTAETVVELLRDGALDATVVMAEEDIADRFLALMEAMRESQEQSEFADAAGAPGGGQGGQPGQGGEQPLIPPIAELKLLRGLQDSIYRATRRVSDRAGLDEALRARRIEELGRSQSDLTELSGEFLLTMQQGGAPPAPVDPDPIEPVEPAEPSGEEP